MFRALARRFRRHPRPAKAKGKPRRRANRRGVALVMVLGAITVLTVFLTELQEETSAELSAATAERDALKAEYYARSAVNLSRLLIASEPTVSQSLGFITALLGAPKQLPIWNFADILLGPFNGQSGLASFGAVSGLDTASAKNLGIPGGGYFDLRIVEEDSKININKGAFPGLGQVDLAKELVAAFSNEANIPLFERPDGDDLFSNQATICSSLIDWADLDENIASCDVNAPSASGVEDNFYQTVGLNYRRKNAPFDSIDELRMVRGMSRDDLWSKLVDPEPNDPTKRTMTPWGNKGLNVNAANAQTLLVFICGHLQQGTPAELCGDPVQAATFIATVTLVRQFTQGIPLFGKPNDFITALEQSPKNKIIGPLLASLGIKPVKFAAQTAKLISTDSRVFSIYAEGVVPGFRKETRVRIHAVVDTRKAKPISEVVQEALQSGQLDGNSRLSQGDGGYKDQIKNDPGGTVIYWRME